MSDSIEHVFVLMLENRSFNHFFAYSGIPGLQGVNTSMTNPGKKAGAVVPMSDTTPNRLWSDPGHEFEDADWQMYHAPRVAGPRPVTMQGFADGDWPEAMACAKPALIPVLTHLAREYLVCDQWFSSMPGPTWPNRFFVHAASSGGLANSPANPALIKAMTRRKLAFSFEHGTIYQALENAGRTWRIYHGDLFPQVCAINTMPSMFVASADRFRRNKDLGGDINGGDVANYTFIEPDYGILTNFWTSDCQHPPGKISSGEQLVHDVAAAVMGNPAVWEKSVLVIVHDEHGGFYDQWPPPDCEPPGDAPLNIDKTKHPPNPNPPFDFRRFGPRVPAVVVSPWVQPGSVSHATYDHASIIRTVFELFGLPGNLTARDAAGSSNSLLPFLTGPLRTETPAALPDANDLDSIPPPPPQPGTAAPPSLHGFARIAAQIDHALNNYQSGMRPEELEAAVGPLDAVPNLPDLPKTDDPDEARDYIRKVGERVEAHRQQQLAGQSP
jgi:phospholipase C